MQECLCRPSIRQRHDQQAIVRRVCDNRHIGERMNCRGKLGRARNAQCRTCLQCLRVQHGNVFEERELPVVDHFAAEMDHMSACVMENKEPLTPGEEGLRDLKIMMAIYEAAGTGRAVQL